MKKTNRIIVWFIAITMIATMMPFASASTIVDSGVCGENLTWTLDENGTLLVRGEGSIADSAFAYRSDIIAAVIEEGVIGIGSRAFAECHSLSSITLPNTLKIIKETAFFECPVLEEIQIPDSVEEIESGAFAYCFNTNVYIGKNVVFSGEEDSNGNILLIGLVKSFVVDEDNSNYSSQDGCLFNKDKTVLLQYPAGNRRTAYTVPSSVKRVVGGAFYLAVCLDRIIYQEGLEEIDAYAHLAAWPTQIILPKSLKKVSTAAFVDYFLPIEFTVKSMDADLESSSFPVAGAFIVDIPDDILRDVLSAVIGFEEPSEDIREYVDHFDDYLVRPDYESGEAYFNFSTIICHAGSTAEAYAIEHGMDYRLTHFFEGEWIYDQANNIRYRKCINCDEREVEQLEVEPTNETNPTNPQTEPQQTKEEEGFRCKMCPVYEKYRSVPVVGWFVSIIHLFVHLAHRIGLST